jgi:Domain of unknown function (DUF4111)/Nucleotidyltransferase domain
VSAKSLDPAAERYLDELVRRVRDGLGERFVAAYLIGSGALGDWRPGRSDIDVLVVCDGPLPRADAEQLVAGLWHAQLPCPTRGLELVAYRRDALRAPVDAIDFELNLNTGPGMEDQVSYDARDEPAHWFLLDVAIARSAARPLTGPPSAELIGPVDRRHVLAALDASLRWHGDEEPASANTVLNACRALRYAVDDTWTSKLEAGRWACEHAADPDLVRAALALRDGGGPPLDAGAVAQFVAGVADTVRSAGA